MAIEASTLESQTDDALMRPSLCPSAGLHTAVYCGIGTCIPRLIGELHVVITMGDDCSCKREVNMLYQIEANFCRCQQESASRRYVCLAHGSGMQNFFRSSAQYQSTNKCFYRII